MAKNTCEAFAALTPEQIDQFNKQVVNRIAGKAHVADVLIEDGTELYPFKVTVLKYNGSGSRGWATTGYARFVNNKFVVSFKQQDSIRTQHYS